MFWNRRVAESLLLAETTVRITHDARYSNGLRFPGPESGAITYFQPSFPHSKSLASDPGDATSSALAVAGWSQTLFPNGSRAMPTGSRNN